MTLRYIVMTLSLLMLVASPAHARKRHFTSVDPGCNVIMPCEGVINHPRGERAVKAMGGFGTARPVYERRTQHTRHAPRERLAVAAYDRGQIIGGRPSGCPHAFCGCEASLYLFGKIIPNLNLAANWLRFPRTSPAPRMAAARHGHVMVLVEHKGGDNWLVHDGNSGSHRTRLHVRSLRGFTVVNPSA